MAELTPKERLQPSLLDRLIDEEPEKQQDTQERRVLSMRKLREIVLRDLSWLLNASNLESVEDMEDYPLVAHSVVNFGLPDLAGASASSVDKISLERSLHQAIVDFEPRILRNSLKVRAVASNKSTNRNALGFEIEGDLWAQPVPLRFYLNTELDLETGNFAFADRNAAGTG